MPDATPKFELGTKVKGEVAGWKEWNANKDSDEPDPTAPSLAANTPQFVEGVLDGYLVDNKDSGLHYFKHIVNGYDVLEDSVTEVK